MQLSWKLNPFLQKNQGPPFTVGKVKPGVNY